eukprot:3153069-Alexandrium_andersonii.AAC.1
MPPAPPAAWQAFTMMGLTTPSSSFSLAPLVLLGRPVLEPVERVLHALLDLLPVAVVELVLELLLCQRGTPGEAVGHQATLGLD